MEQDNKKPIRSQRQLERLVIRRHEERDDDNNEILYHVAADVIYGILMEKMPDTMIECEKALTVGMPVEYITERPEFLVLPGPVRDALKRALTWKKNKIAAV